MANERDLDMEIIVRAVTDEASAEEAAGKLAKKVLSSLKDGCVEIPTALKDPFKGSKATDEITKAQRAFLSEWEKMAGKGFSASTEELDSFIDKFLILKRLINQQNRANSKQNKALRLSGLSDIAQSYVKNKQAIKAKSAKSTNVDDATKSTKKTNSRSDSKRVKKRTALSAEERSKLIEQQKKDERDSIEDAIKKRKLVGLSKATRNMRIRSTNFDNATKQGLRASELSSYHSQFAIINARDKIKADK